MATFRLPRFGGLITDWSDRLCDTLERILAAGYQFGVVAAPGGPAGGDLVGNYPNPSVKSPRSIAAVTNNVGTTLSAAALVGGVIIRTGPGANFIDTTDTAANILSQFSPALKIVGQSFDLMIANASSFNETLNEGTGITFAGNTSNFSIAAGTTNTYRAVVTAVGTPAITFIG